MALLALMDWRGSSFLFSRLKRKWKIKDHVLRLLFHTRVESTEKLWKTQSLDSHFRISPFYWWATKTSSGYLKLHLDAETQVRSWHDSSVKLFHSTCTSISVANFFAAYWRNSSPPPSVKVFFTLSLFPFFQNAEAGVRFLQIVCSWPQNLRLQLIPHLTQCSLPIPVLVDSRSQLSNGISMDVNEFSFPAQCNVDGDSHQRPLCVLAYTPHTRLMLHSLKLNNLLPSSRFTFRLLW